MDDMSIKVFENAEFGTVRTVIIDNEPWFVGKDVAQALGYGQGKSLANAVAKHVCDEDKGVTEMMTPGGKQNVIVINESGMYALVFGSKLESAQRFKHWVTSEILPSIRKHGAYITPAMIEKVLLNPDTIIKLVTELKEEREECQRLERINTLLEPKASYYDVILASPNSVTVTQIVKDYGMSAVKFNQLLHDLVIQYKASDGQWVLYQIYANECYTQSMTSYDTKGNAHMHTRWTQKGRLFLYNKLKNNGILPRRDEESEETI